MSASIAIPTPRAGHGLPASSALRHGTVGSTPTLLPGGAILLWGAN